MLHFNALYSIFIQPGSRIYRMRKVLSKKQTGISTTLSIKSRYVVQQENVNSWLNCLEPVKKIVNFNYYQKYIWKCLRDYYFYFITSLSNNHKLIKYLIIISDSVLLSSNLKLVFIRCIYYVRVIIKKWLKHNLLSFFVNFKRKTEVYKYKALKSYFYLG